MRHGAPLARLVRLAMVAELRSPGIRLIAITGAVAAGIYAWSAGELAGSAGLMLAAWLGRIYGIAACLWFAATGLRDLNPRTGAILRSKPVSGGRWVFVGWLAGVLIWLALLALAFFAAALAQLPAAGTASLASHGLAFIRAGLTVLVVGSMSYALSRILCSPLGGILVMFAWFCTVGGVEYLPSYLRPDYAQNLPFFLPAAALLVFMVAFLVEPFRRGELRRALLASVGLLLLVLSSAAGALRAYRTAPRVALERDTIAERIAIQHLEIGTRIPGFWLPDGKGGVVRTADYPGKVLLIYLFAADDMEAARTLPALETILRRFGGRGVQPIAVCLSPDHWDGWALARGGGYSFPVASDRATAVAASPPDAPIASAYDADILPTLVITDRRRRAREERIEPSYTADVLAFLVNERLAEEPE